MFAKTISAALLGTTLIATAALAQNPTPSTTPAPAASSSSSSVSHSGQWRASKLIGVNVYNANNESLGEINELLTDQSGKVTAAVIGVGGFLGMGERNVAIPFEKIKWSNEPVKSSASASNTAPSGSNKMAPATTTGSSSSSTSSSSSNQWYPDHGILNLSKDELKAMPEFKYST